MARRVRSDAAAVTVPSVWRELKAKVDARAARRFNVDWYSVRDLRSAASAKEMAASRPVVVAGWDLGAHRPDPRSGTHFRVYPTGRVVPVVARRDPEDHASIVGWDEMP